MKTFVENMGVKVIRSNAQQQFYKALSNENDPEIKRKIIGLSLGLLLLTIPWPYGLPFQFLLFS